MFAGFETVPPGGAITLGMLVGIPETAEVLVRPVVDGCTRIEVGLVTAVMVSEPVGTMENGGAEDEDSVTNGAKVVGPVVVGWPVGLVPLSVGARADDGLVGVVVSVPAGVVVPVPIGVVDGGKAPLMMGVEAGKVSLGVGVVSVPDGVGMGAVPSPEIPEVIGSGVSSVPVPVAVSVGVGGAADTTDPAAFVKVLTTPGRSSVPVATPVNPELKGNWPEMTGTNVAVSVGKAEPTPDATCEMTVERPTIILPAAGVESGSTDWTSGIEL